MEQKMAEQDKELRNNKKDLEANEEGVTMYGEIEPSLQDSITPDNKRQGVRELNEETSEELVKTSKIINQNLNQNQNINHNRNFKPNNKIVNRNKN